MEGRKIYTKLTLHDFKRKGLEKHFACCTVLFSFLINWNKMKPSAFEKKYIRKLKHGKSHADIRCICFEC